MFTPVIIYYLGSIREGTHFTGFHVHSSFQLIINLISIVQLFSVFILCNFSCFRLQSTEASDVGTHHEPIASFREDNDATPIQKTFIKSRYGSAHL